MDPSYAGLWALLIALWFVASAVYRRANGRPLHAAREPGAVFVARWVSARFGASLLSRLSTARNCVQVQVTRAEIVVTPHFPFTLGFLAEIYGYDRRIRLADVKSVLIVGGHFTPVVEVQYLDAQGREAALQLLLRRAVDFVAAARPG